MATVTKGGTFALFGTQVATCRYGENAWQEPAGLFSTESDDPLALDKFTLVEGAPLSYNNHCDLDRLLQTVTHIAAVFERNRGRVPLIAIGVKHGNVCGAAVGKNKKAVLRNTMAGDPVAIFGGLIMTSFPVDEELAETLSGKLLDGIVAPGFCEGAIARLRRRGDKCRFVANAALGDVGLRSLDATTRIRHVRGGFLVQPNYTFVLDVSSPDMRKRGSASAQEEADMLLAWAVGSTSNSNTVTLVKDGQLLGNGVGQQDRVGAAQLAVERAKRSRHPLEGAVAYSDSFFPFPDGPRILIDAGVRAVLTSNGSVNDHQTVEVCEQNGVALYMVPDRHGRGFFGH